jgi:hypothetical protein
MSVKKAEAVMATVERAMKKRGITKQLTSRITVDRPTLPNRGNTGNENDDGEAVHDEF